MKKAAAFLLALFMTFSLAACGGQPQAAPDPAAPEEPDADIQPPAEPVELSLWTYPVGGWGNKDVVAELLAVFNEAYPHIQVNVEFLDYDTGDSLVEEAIAGGRAPDLIFEGPERLVAGWGARGLMADLSELWEAENAAEVYAPVRAACQREDAFYEVPICMTAHCMAVNRDLFEAAGALGYLDEESRTWSTEDFVNAVQALSAYGQKDVGVVYCGGQGGDQGTRALVNNLYGGRFTNSDCTAYNINSPENIQALQLLRDLEGIRFAPELVGQDEIQRFCDGELAMAFCWNVAQEIGKTASDPDLDFDILPMAFPTASGEPELVGGIWGLGAFDNGDAQRLEAAKTFIEFMAYNEAAYSQAVLATTYWPVRDIGSVYLNDELMIEYEVFMQYMGDYYQIAPGWAEARTAWWEMLQAIGDGAGIAEAAARFDETANAAAA